MINRERLIDTFRFLAKIDSVSRHEGDIAKELKKILETMGAETVIDGAGKKTGSNTGNLIAKFHGTEKIPP
ncbi:MAG: peptidase T, partial [Proteobacteria bacterium]|nr:peptidase T [Pseudomonadota bacterium]